MLKADLSQPLPLTPPTKRAEQPAVCCAVPCAGAQPHSSLQDITRTRQTLTTALHKAIQTAAPWGISLPA